jgi:hypothetical protein
MYNWYNILMESNIDNKIGDLDLISYDSETDSLTDFNNFDVSSDLIGGESATDADETENMDSLSGLASEETDDNDDNDLREGVEEQDDAPPVKSFISDLDEITTPVIITRQDEEQEDDEVKEATSADIESKDPRKLMDIEYTYPPPKDKNFQEKIFKKREFYYHRVQPRDELKDYAEIKAYRDKVCSRSFELQEHQALLSNFMNPDTPYNGILIFHGVGTGKCRVADEMIYINGNLIRVDDMWAKYNTGILRKDEDGGEWSIPKEELIVNSYDRISGKIVQKSVKHLYRQKVNEKIRDITLENGFSFKITQIHQLLTEKEWTNELMQGIEVAIPNIVYNCPSKNSVKVTHELAQLICLQLVNGKEVNDTVVFSNYTEELGRIIATVSEHYKFKMEFERVGTECIVKSNNYKSFLEKNGYIWNSDNENRSIPEFIMNSPKDIVHTFISDLFNGRSEFSCNKLIAHQLSYLLRMVGYNCVMEKGMEYKLIISRQIQSINSDISYIKIDKVEYKDYDGCVYDVEVEDLHNYVSDAIMHNTCAGISIAEKYKPMIQKYGTKIYVLVSGPFIKENWRNELLKCTGETYLKKQDATQYISDVEQQKAVKNAVNVALQYYRFMSYRSFYKKVLGEKIREQEKLKDSKVKVTYRKTEEGEFERDIAIDRIYNLNNSLIIIDEAHNLTGNAYGEALMKIIKSSQNLKILLMTATPMKNLADDIIELLNFIRPANAPIERDKIFNAHKNHQMDFKEGGIEYMKQMSKGYISYLRGADPMTFAKRVEKGTTPKGLLFTKVISCNMLPFQRRTYDEIIRTAEEDTLDRRSEAVANFSFPGLSQDRKEIIGYYGNEGLNIIKNQLKTHYEVLNKKIATDILGVDEGDMDFMYLTEDNNTISGRILKAKYLKYFSIKFYKALKKISRLIWSKKGARTAFIYSNLVKVGIEVFQEILLQNGYLEYDENQSNYKIKPDTICYFCGKTYRDHQQMQLKATAGLNRQDNYSDSSTEYKLKTGEPPHHTYMPATFISVTGKTSEEAADVIPEDKKRILDNVFSHIDNKEGKNIKFVLGSRVMQEGLSLMNVSEVHILDVYFNLGKVEQVTGRAIRHCSHYKLITDENRFPTVNIYKYSLTLENEGLSTEEEMYQKAELKYILIKKVERALKEVAIDCPLNRHGNIFPEELAENKDCVEPLVAKPGDKICPPLCDYTKCNFICEEDNLNRKYFDESKNSYRKLTKSELDYSTFTQGLARNEIETTKGKIKEMYRVKYVYTLPEIIEYVKKSYSGEKKELFDEFFIFKALDELIPITENDFNNFRDTVFDKFNRPGYLIYINKYYIFQPFDQNDDVPMYYRSTYDKPMKHELTLYNYLKNTEKLKDINEDDLDETENENVSDTTVAYVFEDVMEYYESRNEFTYVGIIDKESSRRRTKRDEELQDVFKIREKREKVLEKKRGTGITSLFGAVCGSRSKDYLDQVAKSINVTLPDEMTRDETCDIIKNRLLFLEKYSRGKEKMTYIIIPSNHPIYTFPLNLEDRKNDILNKINDKIKFKFEVKTTDQKKKFENEQIVTYRIEVTKDKKLDDFNSFFESLGGKLEKNKWVILVE